MEPARQLRVGRWLSQRYALTYVDFRDQKRTVKDSGLCYGKVAATSRMGRLS
jgi:beta-glucosidase/6-phospho-beta-glucosidase/beta-galactosidase